MSGTEDKKYVIFDEIRSQGPSWIAVVEKYLYEEKRLSQNLKNSSSIYFLGSGSSYNNALLAEFAYNKLLGKRSYAINSSEFLFNPEAFIKPGKNDKVFIISRTGETSDTLFALGKLKDMLDKKNPSLIALTTFPESSIAKASSLSISFEKFREESITSNRVVSCITLFLLCLLLKSSGRGSFIKKINTYTESFFKRFDQYCTLISSIINEMDFKKFVFLGTGPFFSVAREASLKTREMSISDTEFWPTLEYRQGYMTNSGRGDLAVVFLSQTNIDFQLKTCIELKKTGAKVLIISDKISDKTISDIIEKKAGKNLYDYHLNINVGIEEELLLQVYYQLFGQLTGYYQAIKKNIDPSNPKDLDYIVKT